MKPIRGRVTSGDSRACHALDPGVCLCGRAWRVQYDAGT